MVEIEPETYLQLKELSKDTGLPHKVLIQVAMDQWGTSTSKKLRNFGKSQLDPEPLTNALLLLLSLFPMLLSLLTP